MAAERAISRQRDESADVLKGILVLQMVLCHCIQFFCDDANMAVHVLRDYINLTTFSGFFFAFGITSWYAYYSRTFRESAWRMTRTALKMLLAFWISSICYVGLVEVKFFDPRQIRWILGFRKYAGWSEFLASFFGVMVVGIILFGVFKKMNWVTEIVLLAVGVLTTLVPRDRISDPVAALFVGSTQVQTFPVISYLFYYGAGVLFCKKRWKWKPWILAVTAAMFLPELIYYLQNVNLTDRFPPDAWFLLGGALAVYGCYLLSQKIRLRFLEEIGANSLFFLLVSNIVIFAFAGSKFKLRTVKFALIFYVLLIAGIWYLYSLIRKPERKR